MEEIDLKELFDIFWNKKVQIILVVLIFIVLGGVYSYGMKTPMYTSSTTLVLVMVNSEEKPEENMVTTTDMTLDVTLNSKLVTTYSELVKSKNILRQVIKNLQIDEDETALKNNVKVTAVEDTELIKISVTHENPAYASKIANEIAKVFSEKINEIYKINNIYIVDEAETPNAPSNINHIKDIIMFAFIGLVISAAYIFIASMLDNTIKTTEDIEKGFELPVLATIPLIESLDNTKGGKN